MGKTGTVQSHVDNQNNDAWMVGYTPSLVASVWVGTDDNTPIQYGDGRPIYGHGIPSDIWQTFMNGATQGTPKQTFGEFVPVVGHRPGRDGHRRGTAGRDVLGEPDDDVEALVARPIIGQAVGERRPDIGPRRARRRRNRPRAPAPAGRSRRPSSPPSEQVPAERRTPRRTVAESSASARRREVREVEPR